STRGRRGGPPPPRKSPWREGGGGRFPGGSAPPADRRWHEGPTKAGRPSRASGFFRDVPQRSCRLQPLEHAKLGAPGSGVHSNLVARRSDRRGLELGEATCPERPEGALDGPVLARVKRDDAEPPAGSQEGRRRLEGLGEGLGFLVDGHAQSLEGPRGDVSARGPRRARHPPLHGVHAVAGQRLRALTAPLHSAAGYAPGVALPSVLE